MFIPATKKECKALNWSSLDIILVTGDSYIDSSYVGVAIIGKYLIHNGYKVGIIPQPSLESGADILRLGAPGLFWGVTSGAIDSMVSNYTSLRKKRRVDVLTSGGINEKRPDRALIRYVNLIKSYSKGVPIVIGGLEASLRRVAHYDYMANCIRRSILLDSKADILVYGEGERTILELANAYKTGENVDKVREIRGICYISNIKIVENDNKIVESSGKIVESSGKIGNSSGEIGNSSGEIGNSSGEIGNSSGEIGNSSGEIGDSSDKIGDSSGKIVENDNKFVKNDNKFVKNDNKFVKNDDKFVKNDDKFVKNDDKIGKNYIKLPDYADIVSDKAKFKEMFDIFYQNTDPINAKGLIQVYENRVVVQNPPNYYLEGADLDLIYELEYENDVHPIHKNEGKVIGLETTKNSITTHRGCFGECNFCSITVHQGRRIRSRSSASIMREITRLVGNKYFKGNINDLGGATSNMYMMECAKQTAFGSCKTRRCLSPVPCSSMKIEHSAYLDLIKAIKSIKGAKEIKKVFINSGFRYDLIQYDKVTGMKFLEYVVSNCTSGQMKIAPEHTNDNILSIMGKPRADLFQFVKDFYSITAQIGKKQFLTYYLIAGHPGCSEKEMKEMKIFFSKQLKVTPKQVQIFTPTPSTYSTMMYYCELDYKNANKRVFVEKSLQKLSKQKEIF